jgi:long-subunit acyl-CoA synthetase (AMP-forming)
VVAEIIAKLIDTPAGKRPERIVAGSAFGADIANEAFKPLQAQMVAGFGLTELGTLKAS